MAGTKNHDYHIIDPSPWPLIGSIGALIMAFGAVFWMKDMWSIWVMLIGLLIVLYTMFGWWSDVIKESHQGDHTPVVQLHLRYGMILFIASEVMFFVAWFHGLSTPAVYGLQQTLPFLILGICHCLTLSSYCFQAQRSHGRTMRFFIMTVTA